MDLKAGLIEARQNSFFYHLLSSKNLMYYTIKQNFRLFLEFLSRQFDLPKNTDGSKRKSHLVLNSATSKRTSCEVEGKALWGNELLHMSQADHT